VFHKVYVVIQCVLCGLPSRIVLMFVYCRYSFTHVTNRTR